MKERDALRAIVFAASTFSDAEKLTAVRRILLADESSIDKVFDEIFAEKREVPDPPATASEKPEARPMPGELPSQRAGL